jgi:PHD/YefM family antitoxin component YafN of YafNO toxin-antitoxin module
VATATVSLEEFQKNADKVSEASAVGPVFITRPGQRTLVVLDIEEYRRLGVKSPEINEASSKEPQALDYAEERPTIVDLLYYPGAGEIEFNLPRRVVDPLPYMNPFD